MVFATLTACGGGKKNDESVPSNRIIIEAKTNLTPDGADPHSFNYQKIQLGKVQAGKQYIKILQYIPTRNGFFTIANFASFFTSCGTNATGQNEDIDSIDIVSTEFRVKYEGSNSFETVGLTRRLTMDGVYLNVGDELNILLTFNVNLNCNYVEMKINSTYF